MLMKTHLQLQRYTITLTWISMRRHISFDPIAVEQSPVNRYEEIRSRHLRENGVHLPMLTPGDWSCPVSYNEELSLLLTVVSELDTKKLQKQLVRALVPEFTDRVHVKLYRSGAVEVDC